MMLWSRPRLWPSVFLLVSLLFATASRAEVDLLTPPSLYTGRYGDCLAGESLFSVTRFDAAYDAPNATLIFYLDGDSNVRHESVMLHISIEAYGKNRLDMMVNPCNHNITSLCPLKPNVAVKARAAITAGAQPIQEMSDTVFLAPDFEGSAKLRIYANSGKTEIACLQAAMTNGRSLSHPEAIAPVLGAFTLIAIFASFATAAYGVSIPHMRVHHAHSLPALVVFETFQAIFFSGALSVNWPANLVAWWSNFAWSAGLIYIPGLAQAVDKFTGVTDHAREIGEASSAIISSGGGSITQILGRSTIRRGSGAIIEGATINSTYLDNDYIWSGSRVGPGLPLPGTWMGFPATLSTVNTPIADAFIVGLIWLAIAIGLVVLAVVGFKISLEAFAKKDRLAYFRSHWASYLGHAMLRTLVIAFFMLMTLTMYQFTIRITVGPIAVAAVVFILALIGMISLVAFACQARTRGGKFNSSSDRIIFHRTTFFGVFPGVAPIRESAVRELDLEVRPVFSIPFFRVQHVNDDPDRPTVHLDEPFVKRFGWFSARYRRTRWWFLAYYIAYLFGRAAFIGGGWQNPSAQIYGLLALDALAFAITIFLNPFEGARNTAIAVWILGVCKITTTGISIAFLPEFNLDRTTAAALGLVIIIIQGLTVIALLILITLSAISSWISLTRNMGDFDPDWFDPVRVAYFGNIEKKAPDAYEPWKRNGVKRKFEEKPPTPPPPRFSVVSVRRSAKIDDEIEIAVHAPEDTDNETAGDEQATMRGRDLNRHSRTSSVRHSRTSSIKSRYSTGSLPRAARPYRLSWSSRDFGDPSISRSNSVLTQRLSGITVTGPATDGGDTLTLNTSSTALVRPQSSLWSLNTASTQRPSSPTSGSARLSREILVGHGEARRPPTALPEAPEPAEEK